MATRTKLSEELQNQISLILTEHGSHEYHIAEADGKFEMMVFYPMDLCPTMAAMAPRLDIAALLENVFPMFKSVRYTQVVSATESKGRAAWMTLMVEMAQ